MARRGELGFTLIEIIIFIVIVGFGVAGVLSVMNMVTMHSADPLVRKQASAMAESVMEEILLKNYCDPDTATVNAPPAPPTCPVRVADDQETARLDYDDVDDYNSKTQTVFLDWPAALSGYTMTINVGAEADVPATAPSQKMKRVTVTVTRGNERVAVVGYRANF